MSRSSAEIVRAIYDAWNRADMKAAEALLDPAVEWVNPADAVEAGTRTGEDGWRGATSNFREIFRSASFQVESLDEVDERLVASVVVRAVGRSSKAETTFRQGHVWTIRGGKIVRYEWFTEPEQARASVGLPKRET